MPQNGLSIGIDYQFGLYDGTTGAPISIGDIQNVKVTKHVSSVSSKPYNGPPRFAHIPDGYSGTFAVVRTSALLETLELTRDANIYAGKVVPASYITKIITNPDGTVTKSQFTNVDWYLTEEADVSKDKTATQTVQWHASNEVPIA